MREKDEREIRDQIRESNIGERWNYRDFSTLKVANSCPRRGH